MDFSEWFSKKAQIIQGTMIYAQITSSMFESFKGEGMTDEQALELTKHSISAFTQALPALGKVIVESGMNNDD